jgi:hypothetical protein
LDGVAVTVRRLGFDFDGEEQTKLETQTNADGLLSTAKDRQSGVYDRVAFLTIQVRPNAALVPIALVDDEPQTVRVASQSQRPGDLLEVKKDLWDQQTYETGQVQQDLFRELKELDAKPNQRGKALERAKSSLRFFQDANKRLAAERDELLKEAKTAGRKIDTSFGEQWLQFVVKGNGRLEEYVTEQERIFKEENDPKRQEFLALVQQARLEEARADFAKALELYEKAVATGLGGDKLKQEYESLKTRWEPKNEAHRHARLYLDTTWPGLDLLRKPDSVKEARTAFEVYRQEKDVMCAQKLVQTILAHGGKLKKQLEALMPDVNEEDARAVETLKTVAEELQKFGLEVQAFAGK